ncbi:hypothetical protein [Paraglaciecola sp. L3A3]|uniref:hypothetical protein n=1 Tax=Paraglaciecola sp. L3A3 TaxID=2686358 RepID=UPI00131BE5E2|nr:hypothetical protein [Paraglaciecola sp. L3A3]
MKLKIGVHIFFILVFVLALLFAVTDVLEAFSSSSQYVFGTEVGGWKYSSETNFLIFNGVQAIISLAVLLALSWSLVKIKKAK